MERDDAAPGCSSRLLIVEDNPLMADALADLVCERGFAVAATVGDVGGALDLLRRRPVDGALVDLNLGGDLSLPICRALAQRRIPYFFLTAYADPWVVPSELRGAGWLVKPVDPLDLDSALRLVERQRARRAEPANGTGNLLLDALPHAHWQALRPRFARVNLRAGARLEAAGEPVSFVHFPVTATVALFASASDGARIEIGMVGSEGAAGAGLGLGNVRAGADACVRTPGTAWRIAGEHLLDESREAAALRAALARYTDSAWAEWSETLLFTGTAGIERRLARWLLMVSARRGERKLEITHAAIAEALAVRRAGVTSAVQYLKSRRLIACGRRSIELIDPAGLLNLVHRRPAPSGRSAGSDAGIVVQTGASTGES